MIEGQWIGKFGGAQNGLCTINIEPKNGRFLCHAYMVDENGSMPSSYAYFTIDEEKESYEIEVNNIALIDTNSRVLHPSLNKQFLSQYYPGIDFPTSATIFLEFKDNLLQVRSVSNIDTVVFGALSNKWETKYCLVAEKVTWGKFKEYVDRVNYREVAFRGQEKPWPLMTSFHRSKRYDVQYYANNDIPMLHRRLTGMTKHYFDLRDHQHFGAFYNLLQHHGYPTPLLDWSYSPYVASYFAFSPIKEKSGPLDERSVRIYVLEIEKWKNDYMQFYDIFDCRMHLSIAEYLTLDNPRAFPQQALTTLTNICDIESYLFHLGGDSDKYLKAFDISVDEVDKVMRDLNMMGITFGTLFPGLDGACYDLKKINFPSI
ncbi:hypothetical protein CG435_15260 [Pantoea ananatis]|uniref:FRG domain-containing protein n=1 Tax=Pantoea ananas TaxID=553 RepID=UPI000D477B42|nr:FRG domain-containing protein [Pantoea ananatis]PQK98903.1 hypothetical protein CG435_15260 [Pantoea ananatis]